jgi:hypothetical protein
MSPGVKTRSGTAVEDGVGGSGDNNPVSGFCSSALQAMTDMASASMNRQDVEGVCPQRKNLPIAARNVRRIDARL